MVVPLFTLSGCLSVHFIYANLKGGGLTANVKLHFLFFSSLMRAYSWLIYTTLCLSVTGPKIIGPKVTKPKCAILICHYSLLHWTHFISKSLSMSSCILWLNCTRGLQLTLHPQHRCIGLSSAPTWRCPHGLALGSFLLHKRNAYLNFGDVNLFTRLIYRRSWSLNLCKYCHMIWSNVIRYNYALKFTVLDYIFCFIFINLLSVYKIVFYLWQKRFFAMKLWYVRFELCTKM